MKSANGCSRLYPAGLAMLILAVTVGGAPPAAAGPQPQWTFNPLAWAAEPDGFRAEGAEGFAVRRDLPRHGRVAVEAEVHVERSVGPQWKVVGVAVYDDPENFWHLALVESPGEEQPRRFIELSQMRAGRWLSHVNLRQSRHRMERTWEPGQTYRLALSLDAEGIEGRVTGAGGDLVGEVRYEFTAEAVTAGRPALRAAGFEARLARVAIDCAEPLPKKQRQFPPYASDSFVPGVQGEATGFFRVEKRDGRWWAIDPLGRGTIVLGIDHVSYGGHWSEALGTQPYRERNDAKYDSRESWIAETVERLKRWGFNSLGAGHSTEMVHRGLAHSQFVGIDGMAWAADDHLNITPHEGRPCSAFPNVFHPKFQAYVRYRVEQRCRPWVGDPWLFGYFLDNELAWWGRGHVDTGLFDAAMGKPADHPAKQALRDFLAERYGHDVARFRDAWGLNVESFDDILARDALTGTNAETVHTDKREFLRRIAELYFGTLAREIRRVDPDHLILGCRFAGGHVSDVVWETAAKYCDVVSINYYGNVDLDRSVALDHDHDAAGDPLAAPFEEFYALAGRRPLLLTEWSFIALDSGLPCTEGAGQRFHTQGERARAAGIYAETLLRMPWMLGYNFFMWVDQPAEGIGTTFPENSNYGLVDLANRPYPELTETLARVHRGAERFRMEGLDALPEPVPLAVPPWQDLAARRLRDEPHPATDPTPLQFTRDGDHYVATNGRLTLRGRLGGPNLADEVLLDGELLGHLHSLVHHVTGRDDRWARTERIESVKGRAEGNLLIVDTLARSDALGPASPMRSFTVRKRLVLPAGADWMVVEFGEVTNTDERPLDLRGVFLQPRSALGGATEGDRPASDGGVPRLWSAAPGDAWVDAGQGLFWGAVAPRGTGVAVRYWLSEHGGQHPDIRWRRQVVLPPGAAAPVDGPVYAILTAGRGGLEGWIACNRRWAALLER